MRASTASAGDEALIAEWEALLARSSNNRVFCAPAWFLAVCACEPRLEPYVVTVRRGDELAALLPLVRDAGVLRFGTRLSDYNDIVALDDEAATAALAFVLDEPLSLLRMRPDSFGYRAATELGLPLEADREMLFADLRGGWDAFLATRSKNFRWNLRSARGRASGLEITELTPARIDGVEVIETLLTLHFGRIPESLLRDPIQSAIVRDAMPRLFAERKLRAFGIFDADRLIAVDVVTTGCHSFGLWNGGFDPAYAAVSPGRLLLHHAARILCDEGVAEFDFLRGDYEYKRQWHTGVRTTWSVNP